MTFSRTFGNDMKLGDYGHFTDSEDFCCEGNFFAELESLSSKADITPRQHKISESGGYQRESDVVRAYHSGGYYELYKPLGLSLPRNDDFKSLLVSFSARLTNRYLITTVIQCPPDPHWRTTYYNILKPFVWHRNEDVGSMVGSEWRGKTLGDQARINVDEMEL
ncbi:hypothetical protein SCLCIDRAFT_1209376 [Scleroderma citrinum Foug A]|uniref:Uncharacterized protein n=1 Tax=Scleroderma citrinum Foug A TaxID=1036808 RepID=A0A0C3EI96_9AGAM|nr:hypothetical protein SCLCIDRAFT_1209376 [Scleroderma citrinum Foug A]